jgi:hypothetical protein
MEKSVKHLLILLLGIAVILGASGFSLIVHHCFTADLTEVSIKSGHSDSCCHHPDHMVVHDHDCCHKDALNRNQLPFAEINPQCCEEGLLSFEGLPVYHKSNSPETELVFHAFYSNVLQAPVFDSDEGTLVGDYIPPPKPIGKHILLVNQVFLL